MILFKNRYKDIQMDSECYAFHRKGLLFILFLFIEFAGGIIWICRWEAAHSENNYDLILFIYDCSIIYSILFWCLVFIFYWKIFYEAKYRISMFTFPGVIMLSLGIPLICFAVFPMKETPTNIAHASVAIYFFTYICLFIYYFRQQKKAFAGKFGVKISRQIRRGFRYDRNKYSFDPSDGDKDGFAEKILNSAAPYLIAIAPISAFIGIQGARAEGDFIVYFVQFLLYIITPYLVRMVAYELGLFFFIRKIEKEYDVTIYNGKAT